MLYAYGVVAPDLVPPPLPGLLGLAVRLLRLDHLAVALSDVAGEPEVTPDRLAEHHRVTLALVQAGGVAPFRFGTVFRDERQLADAVAPRSTALASKLLELAGCVEITARLPLPNPAPASGAAGRPGTAYLLTKKRALEQEDRAREAAARLQEQLSELVRDCRSEPVSHRIGCAARLALLVRQEHADKLTVRLTELEPEARVTGPWAPSSFV